MVNELLQTALQAAGAAAELLTPRLNQAQRTTEKGFLDVVTESDLAADQAIQAVIRQTYPDHFILSEESEIAKTVRSWRPDDRVWWCIDPIDGTSNFSRGLPSWGIEIAVGRGSDILVGVVVDVARRDVFAGGKGLGATLNGKPMHTKADISVQWALINTDWHTLPDKRRRQMLMVNEILPDVRSMRCWGTSALALAHIAAGYQDLYFKLDFNLWDVAGGLLLIQEAGGLVTCLDGSPWDIYSPNLLASGGGEFHQTIVARFAPYLQEPI